MNPKPHIVRMVADRACQLYFTQNRLPVDLPRPRVLDNEIGVLFADGRFIPYADLGFHHDLGFYSLSETPGFANEAAPYAALGQLLQTGQVVVTTGVSGRLSGDEIRHLLWRHTSGDYGEHGEFYSIDITDEMLSDLAARPNSIGISNKVNTLTGMNSVISEYVVEDARIWIVTEAGDNRSTVLLFAGPA